MRRTLIAITIAAAMLPAGAYAKPHRPAPGDADCLVNLDKSGKQYCMTDAEWKAILDKTSADAKADSEPNLKNCTREIQDAKTLGKWMDGIKPNEEDCRPFAAQVEAAIAASQAAYNAKLHHALNTEIMQQCNRMTDVTGIDWWKVAKLRGITVSIDDCAKASAELAAELR